MARAVAAVKRGKAAKPKAVAKPRAAAKATVLPAIIEPQAKAKPAKTEAMAPIPWMSGRIIACDSCGGSGSRGRGKCKACQGVGMVYKARNGRLQTVDQATVEDASAELAQSQAAKAERQVAKDSSRRAPETAPAAPDVVPAASAPAATPAPAKSPRPSAPEPEAIEALLTYEASPDIAERKLWHDIRNRAAYVLVTGALPTHLRPGTIRLLRQMTELSRDPTALDGSAGAVSLKRTYVQAFRLQEHPIVQQARRYVSEGYRLSVSRGPTERRPFGRVWLFRPIDDERAYRATIHSSGAVQAGWV